MDKKNWFSVYDEFYLLSKLLSLRAMVFAWILLNCFKFYLFDITGWDMHWSIKNPSVWNRLSAFWELSLSHSVMWVILAVVLDMIFWPYFFRKENALDFN